jgi:hypothetical protein
MPKKLKKRLGQQFPHARRHERATTTTGAHLPAIFAVPDHLACDSTFGRSLSSTNPVRSSMNSSDGTNQNYFLTRNIHNSTSCESSWCREGQTGYGRNLQEHLLQCVFIADRFALISRRKTE